MNYRAKVPALPHREVCCVYMQRTSFECHWWIYWWRLVGNKFWQTEFSKNDWGYRGRKNQLCCNERPFLSWQKLYYDRTIYRIVFPSHNVRYIAIDDGVDSEKGESEIAPFKNIINEWVARDTSRKVKSAFKTKFAEGAHYGAYAPLGYKKHPDIKGKLLVDDETKWIIEKSFP